jgi:menaquinone-dependent protoporphyrinogen IX oxidase
MDYVMIYWSRYGHNKKIVEYLKEQLGNKGHSAKVFKTDETDASSIPEADVYVFSAAAEAFRLQKHMRKFLKDFNGIDGKNYAIINTHAMKRKNWLKSMDKPLSKKNMQKLAEIDFQIGEGQQTGEGLSEDWQGKLDGFIEKIM